MKIKFLSGFHKDIQKTRDKKLALTILECIELFEMANDIHELPNIKKMKGHSNAYRYRKGKYRIGFFLDDDTITFAAFAPRDKIYLKFL
ncbi:type II toxin-antitoxin system RelE/ParE family toxin [Mangrovibacterium marinum]|uniref:mRNA-degrading endonuclease RelE of RelBE toxin-antitoxin system n=1 Tax=Mangrovibacterium marinum TaxID=1639118 RepID=A0A2T5C077_9BACT|nr:plasmid stabilization protein [Mangrovibacterium marinum]PTN07981.1 mRNA-degrading endonuclease RelE of RelBE toxin-antitoxin system [Mangrovibacterium marinum]